MNSPIRVHLDDDLDNFREVLLARLALAQRHHEAHQTNVAGMDFGFARERAPE